MSLRRFLNKILGDPNDKLLKGMQPLVDQINALEPTFESLSDEQLAAKTPELLERLNGGKSLDDLLPEAFAAVRAASKRTTGMRHFDVQLLGGIALHRGMVVEMKTGEGKTLVATLPLYLNGLTRRGTHLVTVNDYLARRDARWMGEIYHLLGLSVGLLQQGHEQNAFLYDPEYRRPGDDYDQFRPVSRQEAYLADITYGMNSEFGFDYLRDNSVYSLESRVQRPFYYAIVDEVDSILIDEARTPLIISGPASEPIDAYYTVAQVVRQLSPDEYEIDPKARSITLNDVGYDHVERILGRQIFNPDYPEEMSPEQAKLNHHLEQALKAEYIFQRDRDYIVQNRRVIIVDEFTGRTMPGRRWSDGLHQAVEAKEGLEVQQENVTYATITLQNYFRMYEKLSGMTGTAATEAEEFGKIYELDVLVLPTNRPVIREDDQDAIFRSLEGKLRAIAQEIAQMHCLGRPVLVGTASVESSERLSARLDGPTMRKLATVSLLRDHLGSREVDNATWRKGMQVLNQPIASLSPTDLRKMAAELDVPIDLRQESVTAKLGQLWGIDDLKALNNVFNRGIPHNVLNARQHTHEAKIIAHAGQVSAVTIATNMAGRGVDIKLGGEIDEETVAQVNRVLRQNGVSPFGLSFAQMAEALRRIEPDKYYLYQEAVETFLRHVDDESRVKALGGLHVLGTERHEARRIDNQLRGRSGRQGDTGSSRFYISLEDDLMYRFGAGRAGELLKRLGAEDDLPVSLGLVSKAIENAQRQVEGYNFDIRKHLLEYDDVLNKQREVIYEQRKRILSKRDLRDDVWAMVEGEIDRQLALIHAEPGPDGGPDTFRLVAFLDRIQPTVALSEGQFFPSFSLGFAHSELPEETDPTSMRQTVRQMAGDALDSELRRVRALLEQLVHRGLEQIESGVSRLLDAAAIAYEGAEMEAQEAGRELDARTAVQAVAGQTGLPLDHAAFRDLRGRQLERAITAQVEEQAQVQAKMRLIGQVAPRAGLGSLEVDRELLTEADDDTLARVLLDAVDRALSERVEQIKQGLDTDVVERISRAEDCQPETLLQTLEELRFGIQSGFDQQHRRVNQRMQRFEYTAWVADRLAGWGRDALRELVLDHLSDAIDSWAKVWGRLEFQRVGARALGDLDELTRAGLAQALGQSRFDELAGTQVAALPTQDAEAVRAYLGEQMLFNMQRQSMLDATSRLWVEYLTEIEVLRQGIGLQSYGQKDPLAEYKVRAYEMFQELLESIRAQVVAAMFFYRPRDMSQVGAGVERKRRDAPQSRRETGASTRETAQGRSEGGRQRKRRKQRK